MPFLDAVRQFLAQEFGESVDIELPLGDPGAVGATPMWKLSSFELMNGLDVTDFSDTIDGQLFNDLFSGGSS